jgi:hypothetical protein
MARVAPTRHTIEKTVSYWCTREEIAHGKIAAIKTLIEAVNVPLQ